MKTGGGGVKWRVDVGPGLSTVTCMGVVIEWGPICSGIWAVQFRVSVVLPTKAVNQ